MLLIDWLAGLARKTNAKRRSSSSPINRTFAGVVELLEDRTLLSASLFLDINADGQSTPADFISVDNAVVFTSDDGVHGRELWLSDGSAEGTSLLADIFDGGSSSSPDTLVALNNTVFFTADDNINGRELWRTDGTPAGTSLVKDIWPGPDGSTPTHLTVSDDRLFFRASDDNTGAELWVSDGTAVGTHMVRDIQPGTSGSSTKELTDMGTYLLFAADDGINGSRLWRSDGSPAGTLLVSNDAEHPTELTRLGTLAIFSARDSHGTELWKSDGTDVGTQLLKDISEYEWSPAGFSSFPDNLTQVNDRIYFSANDGLLSCWAYGCSGGPIGKGYELWSTNGTSVAGPTNINPDSDQDVNGTRDYDARSSYPDEFVDHRGDIYFAATHVLYGRELARGSAIAADINPWEHSSDPRELTVVDESLFFTAIASNGGTRKLWRFDDSVVEEEASVESSTLSRIEDVLLFSGNGELWASGIYDYGDAPDSYFTSLDNTGARHLLGSTLHLGSNIDGEIWGIPSGDASSDDQGESDEDGVLFVSSLVSSASDLMTSSVTVIASADSKLDAWIDFGRDGVFDHPADHISGGVSVDLDAGMNVLPFDVPVGASIGSSFARFRLSSTGGLLPSGDAPDGEVEDYAVTLLSADNTPDVSVKLPDFGNGTTRLRQIGEDVVVAVDETVFFRIPKSNLGELSISLPPNTSVVTVDLSSGNPIPGGGVAFDGDVLSEVAALQLINGDVGEIIHSFEDDLIGGTITIDALSLAYTGCRLDRDEIAADSKTFTFGLDADVIDVVDDVTDMNGINWLVHNTDEPTISFAAPRSVLTINGGGGDDTLQVLALDTLFDAALSIHGNDGNDNIVGGSLNDSLSGGNGNDVLYGNGGDDTIDGGAGYDHLFESADVDLTVTDSTLTGVGSDTLINIQLAKLFGGPSANTINASSFSGRAFLNGAGGNDILRGGDGYDRMFGGAGRDLIVGGESDDVLRGQGSSYDTLIGGAGNDKLNGGAGNDIISGGNGDDQLTGEDGNDTLDGGNGIDRLFERANVDMTLTDDSLTGGLGNDGLASIETAYLKGGNGHNLLDAIEFTGDVSLIGMGGNDTLRGGLGNDMINGRAGRDLLIGGDGDDTLMGLRDDDTLNGGDGDDWLDGGTQDDAISGWTGDDYLYGRNGYDTLVGGEGNDSLYGASGDDILQGDDGKSGTSHARDNDRLDGGSGIDSVRGGGGSDTMMDDASEVDENFTYWAEWVDAV